MSGIALQQHERGMVGWLFWSELPAPPAPPAPAAAPAAILRHR